MKRSRSLLVAMAAIVALLMSIPAQASTTAEVDFTAQAIASGLTAAQADDLQKRVDAVLADIPGGKQVSPTEIRYDGLNVTVDPFYTKSTPAPTQISCANGWFCIHVRGTRYEFYTCQTWSLSNWWGVSPFNNNQTTGTLARAYASNGTTVVFSHRAKGSGSVDVAPWWYFRPC